MEKDHLEILLEDIRGKFDLVLEGHDALHKEIRDTREELCEKINLVDFKVGALNRKIEDVEARLNHKIEDVEASLSQKIDAVAENFAAHRRDTEAHPSLYKVNENS
jgi:sigma54-dependent transcription regulator